MIAPRSTTQSATDSPRRPYCSRAYDSAKRSSAASTEPACWNAWPLRSWRRPRRSRCEQHGPHPGGVLARLAAEVEPVLGLRPVPGDDAHQLVPVRLGVEPAAGLLVLAQLRIGHGQAELPDLRHVAVEELPPRLVVALALDPPDEH